MAPTSRRSKTSSQEPRITQMSDIIKAVLELDKTPGYTIYQIYSKLRRRSSLPRTPENDAELLADVRRTVGKGVFEGILTEHHGKYNFNSSEISDRGRGKKRNRKNRRGKKRRRSSSSPDSTDSDSQSRKRRRKRSTSSHKTHHSDQKKNEASPDKEEQEDPLNVTLVNCRLKSKRWGRKYIMKHADGPSNDSDGEGSDNNHPKSNDLVHPDAPESFPLDEPKPDTDL